MTVIEIQKIKGVTKQAVNCIRKLETSKVTQNPGKS